MAALETLEPAKTNTDSGCARLPTSDRHGFFLVGPLVPGKVGHYTRIVPPAADGLPLMIAERWIMPEIITCPSCQRRLLLAADPGDREVQCSGCGTAFRAGPLLAPIPVEPAVPPPEEVLTVLPADDQDVLAASSRPPLESSRSGSTERPIVTSPLLRKPAQPSLGLRSIRVALVVAAVMGLILFYLASEGIGPGSRRPKVAAQPENPEQRLDEIREAFRDPQPAVAGDLEQELTALFDDFGDALKARDADRLAAHFHPDRMVAELEALDILPRRMLADKRRTSREIRATLGQALQQQAPLLEWARSEIKNIRHLGAGEVVVIVRHRTAEGVILKMRWWATRQLGVWKLYDFEDLDMGMRFTTTAAAMAGQGFGNLQEAARAVNNIRDALVAMVSENDLDKAEQKLRQVAEVKLPAQLDGVRWVVTSLLYLQREQFQAALDGLQRAERLHPDMPILNMLKGTAYNRLGQWKQALEHLEAYRDLLGEDAVICYQLGEALRGLQRWPEAAAACRKALDHNPKESDAFLGLLRALRPEDDNSDVAERFARLDNPRENFDVCAEDCRTDRDATLLPILVRAMRKIDPNHVPVDYYDGIVRAWAGQADEATLLFRSALARQAEAEKRTEYVNGFLQAMVQGGKAPQAYTAAPEPREAFRFLAGELKKGYRPDDLKQLVAAHAVRHPDDPLLPFYQGEVYVQEGHYLLAEKAFAAGMDRPPADFPLETFRSSRVQARYYSGQGMSAYKEIGPAQETFVQLAGLYLGDHQLADLEALLDARVKTAPDDFESLCYRYRLRIRQDRTAEAVALFRKALAREKEADAKQSMVRLFLMEMAEEGKVLEAYRAAPNAREAFPILANSLLEDNRIAELRQLLDAHRQHDDDIWLAFYTGEWHLRQQAWGPAADAFKSGLDKAEDDARNRFRSNYVWALYKSGRAMQAYREVEPRQQTFVQLAELLLLDHKGEELAILTAAHRAETGDTPQLLYYKARAAILAQQFAEAAVLLRQAYDKQPDVAQRNGYVTATVHEMARLGKGLEGYRNAPNPHAAFETLAREWVMQKKPEELQRLLDEHQQHPEADEWLPFFWGELHLLRGNVEQAERRFNAGLATAKPANAWSYRNGLFRARLKAGKIVDTYQEFGHGSRLFEQLAYLCLDHKEPRQLDALLAEHRKAHADDPNLLGWELDSKWLKQDQVGVLALIQEHRQGMLRQPRFRWKIDQYLVRCLVKLDQPGEALREAEQRVKEKRGGQTELILAHAANGNVQRVIELVEARQWPELLTTYYQDADLGPILRGKAFAAFQKRFPEPKQAVP